MRNPFRGIPRPQLHPLDEARILKAIIPTFGIDGTAALARTSAPFIRQRLRLLCLVPDVQRAFRGGKVSVSQAVEISFADPEKQPMALQFCGSSVRKLRGAVKRL